MKVIDFFSEKKAQELTSKAYEVLDEGDFDAALDIANKLYAMNCTSAYEIEALVYYKQNHIEKTIKVLRGCVNEFSELYSCWQLLGTCHSDLGEYPEAEKCYEQALKCVGDDKSEVLMNLAVLYARQGQSFKALTTANQITDAYFYIPALRFKIEMYIESKNYLKAIGLGNQFLDEYPEEIEADENNAISSESSYAVIASLVFDAMVLNKSADKEIRCFLNEWLEPFPTSRSLLHCFRELKGQKHAKAQYFYLQMECQFRSEKIIEDQAVKGFIQEFYVYCNSKEEALSYIKELDPEFAYETWIFEEVEKIRKEKNVFLGLESKSERHFYIEG